MNSLLSWFRDQPQDAVATCAFATLVVGIGLLSIPWAMIVGGGLVFVALVLDRVLSRGG